MTDLTNFVITKEAEQYLADLLSKQEDKTTGIRIFITAPGTPHAETCLTYCAPNEAKDDDLTLSLTSFTVFIDAISIPFLADAIIDYVVDRLGGQLTIKAPNAKLASIDENSSLGDKINYFLQTEINPNLASHGGQVALIDIVENNIAILRFGGGCQGCGMVDVTLKDGVEKTLRERIPELAGVRDVTDHTNRENAYY